jgi:hypothetical protein
MTSGDYEIQEQQEMDAHNQALCEELRDREISLHNREAAKLRGRAATIRRLYAEVARLRTIIKRYDNAMVAFNRSLDPSDDPVRYYILRLDATGLLDTARECREAAESTNP